MKFEARDDGRKEIENGRNSDEEKIEKKTMIFLFLPFLGIQLKTESATEKRTDFIFGPEIDSSTSSFSSHSIDHHHPSSQEIVLPSIPLFPAFITVDYPQERFYLGFFQKKKKNLGVPESPYRRLFGASANESTFH